MQYQPRPIDATQIELPKELLALVERLAENTHDVWARQRTADGWTYGPRRDDAAKSTRVWYPMWSCRREKKSTTEPRRCKRSRPSSRWATASCRGNDPSRETVARRMP